MRRFLRAIAHARMAEDGLRHVDRRQGMRRWRRSIFALHWRQYLQGTKKKRRRRAA